MDAEHRIRSGEVETPLLYDLQGTSQALGGLGRTSVYALFKEGSLRPVKIGNRTFVTDAELRRYVAGLSGAAQ